MKKEDNRSPAEIMDSIEREQILTIIFSSAVLVFNTIVLIVQIVNLVH